MTCKDCIGIDYCDTIPFPQRSVEKKCKHFKKKVDFVEIVRCKNCIHGEVSIIARTKDGKETWGCYCNVKNKVTDVDAYCSFGKKRGNENGDKQ